MQPVIEEYSIAEAKSQLSRLVAKAHDHGVEIVINVYNKPMAKIVPIGEAEKKTGHSCLGILARYADPSRIELEDSAWEKAVKERHETDRH